MTPADRHIQQWKHNRAFLQSIRPEYHDWMIVGMFYTALHAIDTLLASRQDEAQDHTSRNGKLSQSKSYQKIWESYRPLYALSRSVRYFAEPSTWIPPDKIQSELLNRHLYPIEKSVIKLAKLSVADAEELTQPVRLQVSTPA